MNARDLYRERQDPRIGIVYCPQLSPAGEQFISLRKAREFWERITHWSSLLAIAPRQATTAQLKLAHEAAYVEGVTSGRCPNGFGSSAPHLTEQARWACGAMIAATEHALERRTGVCATVSSLAQAGWNYGAGFCTFNGLLVAERVARSEGWLGHGDTVLIYDGDASHGGGCVDIIQKLGIEGEVRYLGRDAGIDMSDPIGQLRDLSKDVGAFALVLYQAGVDAYSFDPRGPGNLLKVDLEERDRVIFRACATAKVPLVWNLGSGCHETASVIMHESTWKSFKSEYRRASRVGG